LQDVVDLDAEFPCLHVPVLSAQDVALGVRKDERGIALDVQALCEVERLAGLGDVKVEGHETLAQQLDHGRVAESGGFELAAPDAIVGAEVDDERSAL